MRPSRIDRRHTLLYVAAVWSCALLLAACGASEPDPDAAVVATVGDAVITAEAFKPSS